MNFMREWWLRKFAAIVALLAMIATVVWTWILVILDNINNPVQDDQSVNLNDLTPEQLDEFYRSIWLDPDNMDITDDDTELDWDNDSSLIKKDIDIDKLLNNPDIVPAASSWDAWDAWDVDEVIYDIEDDNLNNENNIDGDMSIEVWDDETQDLDSIDELDSEFEVWDDISE